MEDVQNRPDDREVALDEVGINGLRYRVVVSDNGGDKTETIGEFSLAVALPPAVKGTHMSRFVEIVDDHATEISTAGLAAMLATVLRRLHAPWARVRVDTELFRERRAPVSGACAQLGCQVSFAAEGVSGGRPELEIHVVVPVTSVCPCSKAISDYGAHNQRGRITIGLRLNQSESMAVTELIDLAESAGSAPVYPLLKRPDERYVTMLAYDNPVFVEDMARTVAQQLRTDPRVAAFRVHTANDESIHDHAAFAAVEWPHRGAFVGRGQR